MRKMFFVVIACFLVAANAQAMEDTQENRLQEASRYLEAMPPDEMLNDMIKDMASRISPENKNIFTEVMNKQLKIDVFAQEMKEAMARNFTADELGALADFYGSPIGQSAMKKFGSYMADVMPKVQEEMMKAGEKALKEMHGPLK